MKKEKISLINSTHLNVGKEGNEVAFLFSCPGQMEEDLKKPVACQTGVNLNILLEFLKMKNENIFQFTDRYDYRITNSWDKVEFKDRTDRTEATSNEIKNDTNIKRLKNELDGMKILILFGSKAQEISNFLSFEGITIKSRHLSFQSLNQIKKDNNNNTLKNGQKGNTKKRLEVVANEIFEAYGSVKKLCKPTTYS